MCPAAAVTTAVGNESLYVDSRINRDKSRSRRMEVLQKIIDNTATDASYVKEAQSEMMELSRLEELESNLES
jgi:hypothetical protein